MGKPTYDRETLARWDREHLWHPFTQMQGFRQEELLIITRGQGNYLFDLEGNRYLDGVSSLWANLHGHRRAELDRAVTDQLGQVAHSTLLGLAHPPAIVLARRLAQLAPAGLTKVFFSDDGSTAVEVALKLAFQYWQNRGRPEKRRFLKLSNSYHGDTLGSVSVGGIPLFHQVYHSLLFDTLEAPSPYCYRCPHLARLPGAVPGRTGGAGGGAPRGVGRGHPGAHHARRRRHVAAAAGLLGEGSGSDPKT